jgi:hypothetical protein
MKWIRSANNEPVFVLETSSKKFFDLKEMTKYKVNRVTWPIGR